MRGGQCEQKSVVSILAVCVDVWGLQTCQIVDLLSLRGGGRFVSCVLPPFSSKLKRTCMLPGVGGHCMRVTSVFVQAETNLHASGDGGSLHACYLRFRPH